MKILITGHTGFKGSWLTMLLASRGHQVHGLALDPEQESLYEVCNVQQFVVTDHRIDVRNRQAVNQVIRDTNPDFIFHLAAQPLVRDSYRFPIETVETNVLGTLNILSSVREIPSLRGLLVVTTDKVYRNTGDHRGYREGDPLGGDDLYSASKSMADILSQAWAKSIDHVPLSIARAGNVVGGGDWSKERLVPDIVRALLTNEPLYLRYPQAVRPWQHVFDCLNGYLVLAQAMVDESTAIEPGSCWNFGPSQDSLASVESIVTAASQAWGTTLNWQEQPHDGLLEASVLTLDSSLAGSVLGWRNHMTLKRSIDSTIDWYRRITGGANPLEVSLRQLAEYPWTPGNLQGL